jgi:hypothetical protein
MEKMTGTLHSREQTIGSDEASGISSVPGQHCCSRFIQPKGITPLTELVILGQLRFPRRNGLAMHELTVGVTFRQPLSA